MTNKLTDVPEDSHGDEHLPDGQKKIWRDAMLNACPEITHGRLDMHSWVLIGDESVPVKYIYVEGRERIAITDQFCDHVAFAAGDYQTILRERNDLINKVKDSEEWIAMHKNEVQALQEQVKKLQAENLALNNPFAKILSLETERDHLQEQLQQSQQRVADLEATINNPLTHDFIEGVKVEIPFQEYKWGSEHDAGKLSSDWFWLIGYLSGKALRSAIEGDEEKAKHHIITTAAALGNWFKQICDAGTMRPGKAEKEADLQEQENEKMHFENCPFCGGRGCSSCNGVHIP